MAADVVPRHVGVIMDGNRRWAAEHTVTAAEGHRAGFEALFALVPIIKRLGIPYFTVYVFSAENWQRSQTEVKGIMKLLLWIVKNRLQTFKKEGIRIRIIGSRVGVPSDVLAALDRAESETAQNTDGTLGVCFNYGGQQEIVDAAKQLMQTGSAERLTPELFAQHLYVPDIPPLDLVIRTSGEQRTSNFMLWRAAYAELYFTDVLWPDFNETELLKALQVYVDRQRRFGA